MSSRTNPLACAMEEQTKYTYGNNGAVELKSSGTKLLDSFTNLIKDTPADMVKEAVKQMILELSSKSEQERGEYVHDIFMLAFHKRSTSKTNSNILISDGEGCKNIYYEYILELYNVYPVTIVDLFKSGVPFVYGYWKDALNIWVKINELDMPAKEKYIKYNDFIKAFRYAMLTQRNIDLDIIKTTFSRTAIDTMNSEQFKAFLRTTDVNCSDISISNVGKFCVREGTSFDKSAYWYNLVKGEYRRENHVSYMLRGSLKQRVDNGVQTYPKDKGVPFGAKKVWRLSNARLDVILDVAETHFAGKTWSEIKIGHLPSLCYKRNAKGLINEKLKEKIEDGSHYIETGNRYPEELDRVQCREHVVEHMLSGKTVNSSQIYPHTIISTTGQRTPSSLEKQMIISQWESLLKLTQEKMNTIKEEMCESMSIASNAISTGNILACCDVSGSMTWVGKYPERPYDIATALTAFISELSNDDWKDISMSYSSIPNIISFKDNGRRMDVFERITTLSKDAGYSTNYFGLHKELLRLCKSKNIKEENLPVLLVLSDGHFDAQVELRYNGKRTTHQNIVHLWQNAGYQSPPVIVYWNLAGTKTSVQTSATMPGVQLLSGASPSNFKYVLYGEMAEDVVKEVEIDGEILQIKTKDIDPWQTFRMAMEQPYFESIRDILRSSKERELEFYN